MNQNSNLQTKCTPRTDDLGDGRCIMKCTDENNDGFQIVVAPSYIRFDKLTNGTVNIIRMIDI